MSRETDSADATAALSVPSSHPPRREGEGSVLFLPLCPESRRHGSPQRLSLQGRTALGWEMEVASWRPDLAAAPGRPEPGGSRTVPGPGRGSGAAPVGPAATLGGKGDQRRVLRSQGRVGPREPGRLSAGVTHTMATRFRLRTDVDLTATRVVNNPVFKLMPSSP